MSTKPKPFTVYPGIPSMIIEHKRRWNFEPLTVEQINEARRNFIRTCAGADQDAKISESLNEAVQAPMNQAAMNAAVERMANEIKKQIPGVDKPIDVEQRLDRCFRPEKESRDSALGKQLVTLRHKLTLMESNNRQANEARRAKYQEFMHTQAQERSHDLQRREKLLQEIHALEVDMRPEGESTKSQALFTRMKQWVDTDSDCVTVNIQKSDFDQAEDRIHRHWEAYDGPKGVVVYGSKQPCPDCGGSGEYVGFNHTEICPSCKGSKVV